MVSILKRHCKEVDIRRFDAGPDGLEATFKVTFGSFDKLDASRVELRALDPDIHVSFLDNRGFGNLV